MPMAFAISKAMYAAFSMLGVTGFADPFLVAFGCVELKNFQSNMAKAS